MYMRAAISSNVILHLVDSILRRNEAGVAIQRFYLVDLKGETTGLIIKRVSTIGLQDCILYHASRASLTRLPGPQQVDWRGSHCLLHDRRSQDS